MHDGVLNQPPEDAQSKTRFPLWYRIVGAALEHASAVYEGTDAPTVDFESMFTDENNEESETLGLALNMLCMKFPDDRTSTCSRLFTAAEVAKFITEEVDAGGVIQELLFPGMPNVGVVSPHKVKSKLKTHIGHAVDVSGGRTLVLKVTKDTGRDVNMFYVAETKGEDNQPSPTGATQTKPVEQKKQNPSEQKKRDSEDRPQTPHVQNLDEER
jgi:hypothetical protein